MYVLGFPSAPAVQKFALIGLITVLKVAIVEFMGVFSGSAIGHYSLQGFTEYPSFTNLS